MIYFSVCSRKEKKPKSLSRLLNYCKGNEALGIKVSYDSTSIYQGHKDNLEFFKSMPMEDGDIIVLCHDDLDIISRPEEIIPYLRVAREPGVGFVGLAGSCFLPPDGSWWNARKTGSARGFVFQGENRETMTPNYFGKSGQVIFLDGCFMAITYGNLKKIGLEEPEYLGTGWDFYDIHLSYKSYLEGFSNYTIPIIAMHESPGIMREGWFTARDKFIRHHAATLNHSRLMVDKTNGLPSKHNYMDS
tara:strand:- start:466 stop:1203 length:738 start_codon:yes stop_codon:yes gene_type:complete